MFQLSQKAIDEFKKIYSRENGVDLSNEDANRLGIELLEFMKLIFKPIPLDSIGLRVFFRCDCLFSFSKNVKQLDFNLGFLYPLRGKNKYGNEIFYLLS